MHMNMNPTSMPTTDEAIVEEQPLTAIERLYGAEMVNYIKELIGGEPTSVEINKYEHKPERDEHSYCLTGSSNFPIIVRSWNGIHGNNNKVFWNMEIETITETPAKVMYSCDHILVTDIKIANRDFFETSQKISEEFFKGAPEQVTYKGGFYP